MMNANNSMGLMNNLLTPSPAREQQRVRFSKMIIQLIAGIFFVAGTSIFFVDANASDGTSALALSIDVVAGLMFYLSSENVAAYETRILRFLLLFFVGMGAIGLFISGTAVVASIISLVFAILISSVMLTGRMGETSLSIGLFSAFLILTGGMLMEKQQITLPFFQLFLPPILGVLVISYMVMLTMGIVAANLRVKLIVITLFMVVLPLVVLSVITSTNIQNTISEQRNTSLSMAAMRTGQAIDTFFDSNLKMINEDSRLPLIKKFLQSSQDQRTSDQTKFEMSLTFSVLQQRNAEFSNSYALLDETGTNIYDTNDKLINQLEGRTDYFFQAFVKQQPYVSDVKYSQADRKAYFYFSAPIIDDENNSLGVLRARFNAEALQAVLEQNKNLAGQDTFPILIDENQVRLADAYNSTFVFKSLAPLSTSMITELISTGRLPNLPEMLLSTNMVDLAEKLTKFPEKKSFSAQMTRAIDGEKVNEVLATAPLKNRVWTVLYTQRAEILEKLIKEQATLSFLIAILIAGLTAVIATVVSSSISNPVVRLTSTAEKIVAGDLSAKAEIITSDEVGVLANMFNAMTSQLRMWISNLEERVQERTHELDEQNKSLAYRSRQIETIAEVARNISSTQDLTNLLNLVTNLISERFGFYHVGVFLVDDSHQNAVLRAANSTGGKRMLARKHTLKVGQVGIVGYVTGHGEARIATDVGEDAVYFNNPDLPQTRSEMALPLKSGDEVIGALDVQSTASNAFTQQDIELFSTLADQIAIGIVNSRLLEDTNRALEEAQNIHRQYLRQEWVKQVSQQSYSGYQYSDTGTTPITEETAPELAQVFETGEKVITSASQANRASLGVPIMLKGQVIGAIQLQDSKNSNRVWNETEIAAASAVADQIGQALESARLFEQTVRRAERERKALEITSKIRATNDPQAMLEIAMAEVQKALGASRVQVVFAEKTDTGDNHNGHHPD